MATERRPRRRAHLASRLVLLVLLVMVPLAALGVVNALHDRDTAATQTYARTGQIVATGAGVIDALMDQTALLLATTARTGALTGAPCRRELETALVPDGPYRNLYAVDPQGRLTCTSTGQPLGDDVSGTTWFRSTVERQAVTVTAHAEGVTSGEAVMVVSVPRGEASPPAGAPADIGQGGYLAASMDLQDLVAFTDRLELPAESVVQVLDQDGHLLARTSDVDRYRMVQAPLFPRLEAADHGDLEGRGVDGADRLYSYQRVDVGGQSLYVMAGITRAEAYAGANRDLVWSIGVLGVLGVAVAAVALMAGRSLVVAPVERLREAMAGFRSGDVTRRVGDIGGPAEIEELGRSFDAMADQIQARLEDQQRLLDQLEEASEAERQSISAGIHDETLQNLSALGIRLRLLRRWLDDPDRQGDIDRILAMLDDTSGQLRGLLYDIRPPEFDQIGLLATLRETLEVRFADVLDDWSVTGELDPAVPDWAQTLLYRVAMQALANVRQHAGAGRVDIRVGTTRRGVSMEVTDDGRGFDVAVVEQDNRPGHIGLRVMRDRARSVGGEVTITSEPGAGTTVRVDVPLPGLPPVPDGSTDRPDAGG